MSDEARKAIETAKLVRSVVVDIECQYCHGKRHISGGKYRAQGEVISCPVCNGKGTVHASITLPMLYDLLMGNVR